MHVLLLLLVILVSATNALKCWQGLHVMTTPGGTTSNLMVLEKCPAGHDRCSTLSCSIYGKALEGVPGILPGTKSVTTTAKDCLPEIAECVLQKTDKNSCKMSCCKGNGCNGTLGLRSLGTVTAIMALFAVFFVRWN